MGNEKITRQTWEGEKRPEAFLFVSDGKLSAIDIVDYDNLSQFRWYTTVKCNVSYAMRRVGHWTGPNRCAHVDIFGVKPGMDIDHINGNGLDNRRSNLRSVSHRNNLRNIRNSKRMRIGKMKGASRNRGKWIATIGAGELYKWSGDNGKSYVRAKTLYLGTFDTEEQAGRAYDAAARKHFGEFAACNFPEVSSVE